MMTRRFVIALKFLLALVIAALLMGSPSQATAFDDSVPPPNEVAQEKEEQNKDLEVRIAEIQKQIYELKALEELDLLTPAEQQELKRLEAELEKLQREADSEQDDEVEPSPVPSDSEPILVRGWIAYRSTSSRTGYRAVEPTTMIWRQMGDPRKRYTTASDWIGRFQLRLPPGEYQVSLYLRSWWQPLRDQRVTVEPKMREPYFIVAPAETIRR